MKVPSNLDFYGFEVIKPVFVVLSTAEEGIKMVDFSSMIASLELSRFIFLRSSPI